MTVFQRAAKTTELRSGGKGRGVRRCLFMNRGSSPIYSVTALHVRNCKNKKKNKKNKKIDEADWVEPCLCLQIVSGLALWRHCDSSSRPECWLITGRRRERGEKKRGTMAGLKLLYAEMKWTRLKRKHPSPLSHEMVGRSEPADAAAVCDTGGKSLITPAARCNPVCDAEDTKIHRERAGQTRGQRPQCPFF